MLKKEGKIATSQKLKIWQTETVDIDRLIEPEYNPRVLKNPDRANAYYKKIERLGFAGGIVWNKKTGHIVGGAWRVQKLKEAGVKKIDVTVVNLDLVKEKELNDLLNVPARDFDDKKRRENIAEIFSIDISFIDYLTESDRRILIPETRPIQLPDDKFMPSFTQGRAEEKSELESELEISSGADAVAVPRQEVAGHLISFVIDELDKQVISQVMDQYGVVTEKAIFMKGIYALLDKKKKKGD